MTRDELLDASADCLVSLGLAVTRQARDIAAAALDVVLAAGEKRWLCRYWDEFPRGGEEWGPEEWSTCHHGHELNDGVNKDRGCGWVIVLPASLGEQ